MKTKYQIQVQILFERPDISQQIQQDRIDELIEYWIDWAPANGIMCPGSWGTLTSSEDSDFSEINFTGQSTKGFNGGVMSQFFLKDLVKGLSNYKISFKLDVIK